MRIATTLAALLLASSAHAATITIQRDPFAPLGTALDVSGLTACAQSGSIATNVGTFTGSASPADASPIRIGQVELSSASCWVSCSP